MDLFENFELTIGIISLILMLIVLIIKIVEIIKITKSNERFQNKRINNFECPCKKQKKQKV